VHASGQRPARFARGHAVDSRSGARHPSPPGTTIRLVWLGKHVGLVKDAKEELERAVQPRARQKSAPREYEERDSTTIAQNIVADGLLRSFDGTHRSTPHPSGGTRRTRSDSFGHFRTKVLAIGAVEDPEG
jgi:hypothetical protein